MELVESPIPITGPRRRLEHRLFQILSFPSSHLRFPILLLPAFPFIPSSFFLRISSSRPSFSVSLSVSFSASAHVRSRLAGASHAKNVLDQARFVPPSVHAYQPRR